MMRSYNFETRFESSDVRSDSCGIRYENSETALVPYIPPEKTNSIGDFLDRLFLSRRSAYLFFLGLFFFLSALARCVCLQNRGVSLEAYRDLREFSVSGGFGFAYRFYLPQFVCAFAAFLAGFTVFALPVAVLAFAHSQFCLSFFYFALTENALSCGFYRGLAALLYFALFAAASVFYYTEVLFTNGVGTVRGLLIKGFACLAYLFVAFFALRFFSTAFFH